MADLDLSSTSGDRIQAGTGKRCLKFQGKKADLKVEKADLKQSPLLKGLISGHGVTTFTPDTFYTKHLLHKATFTPDTFYTRHFLHQAPFTPNTFYTRHLSFFS